MNTTTTWQDILRENKGRYLDELCELLRFPSVSTDEASADEVRLTAEWVAARLRKAGMENVQLFPTGVHQCVYGDWLHAPGKPTLLIYGHFDVQPADPIELWESPPFEPLIKEGRIYARGAADMKGNLLLCLIGAEAMLAANGSLPVNIKFLFEGQEEIGSRDLQPFVAHRELLACDLCLTPDSLQWSDDQPAMWMGTKGLCALQIDLETAMDMHSGLYGGGVPNANHALAELLSTFHDRDGNILVEGFYDQVIPITPEERASFAKVPLDAEAYQRSIGIDALPGETGCTTWERVWARPTFEINGMWGGYQGDGLKTVIPAQAHAKISCRLVADQEPSAVQDALEAHIKRHTPVGARVKVTRPAGTARAYRVPMNHAGVRVVADVLEESYGRSPYFVRIGGSLPITDIFLQELNAYTIPVGFGQDDERAHSPNEFMRLADFDRGMAVYAQLFERFGQMRAGEFGAS